MSCCKRNTCLHVIVFAFSTVTWCAFSSGCGSLSALQHRGWMADYDTAGKQVRETGRDMLIWYLDPRPGRTGSLKDTLEAPVIKDQTRGYVRCRLFRSYEPDRRFVAQFGIERAPALIVVHTDGTYHSLTGPMPVDVVYRFLAEAVAPGISVATNRYIPRRAEYRWHGNIASAQNVLESTERAILYVFYRRLTNDWRGLAKLLSRREVYQRFADMVHCRVGTLNRWAKSRVTEFGSLRLPALVVAKSDGTYHVLEMPTSYEGVVRLADQSSESSATAQTPSAAAVARP